MSKRLVVCCDGTWNTPDQGGEDPSPTNVTRLALQVVERPDQRLHYIPGVGTSRGERLRGGVFGIGLSRNVRDGYRWLVENYEPGDELFLFGFSRGAFTARSLAGLIRNCGILRRELGDKVDVAYDLYRSARPEEHPNSAGAELFRKVHSHAPVGIHVLGVWDTVGALGIPGRGFNAINKRWRFHDTTLSSSVSAAFHALAVDERRGAYVPTLWTEPDRRIEPPSAGPVGCACPAGREVAQVWFSGVHSDVGGGYPESELADVTFRWMTQRAAAHGLVLDGDGPQIDGTASPEARDRGDRLVPLASGLVHDSMKWWARLPPATDRTLAPERTINVRVASSVGRRDPDAPSLGGRADAVPPTEVDHRTDENVGPLRFDVRADRTSSPSPVVLTEGGTYAVSATGTWFDAGTPCGPAGYDSRGLVLRLSARLRRSPGERWFQLMGEVGRHRFPLRDGEKFVAPASGRMSCWPNDVRILYGNNSGHVAVTVERVPEDGRT